MSIFHCNTRSLPKNLNLLNDILLTLKIPPDIIAISETKLNENTPDNIAIPGYTFLGTNSQTNAGGVGLYISENIVFVRRQDLEVSANSLESCFIKVQRRKHKNMIIACIYRHPHNNCVEFQDMLRDKLDHINNLGLEALIAGDININFLNCNSDKFTSEYLDMLLNLVYMPVITKATRITEHTATLIDHMYTKLPENLISSGICASDISDHLPCFCIMSSKLSYGQQPRFFTDFSNFNNNLFTEELNMIDFMSNIDIMDINKSMNNIINTLQEITNKHAPMYQKTSNREKRQMKKPWISNCILVSIRRKQKMFKTHYLSRDPDKIKDYKIYSNNLNKIKQIARKQIFGITIRNEQREH